MVRVHETVGILVVVAFLALIVVNALRASGRTIGFARPVSYAASGLLVLQVVLGLGLLGSGYRITWVHYVIALAAVATVGVEHAITGGQKDVANANAGARQVLIANVATFVLVLIAYNIGMNNK